MEDVTKRAKQNPQTHPKKKKAKINPFPNNFEVRWAPFIAPLGCVKMVASNSPVAPDQVAKHRTQIINRTKLYHPQQQASSTQVFSNSVSPLRVLVTWEFASVPIANCPGFCVTGSGLGFMSQNVSCRQ